MNKTKQPRNGWFLIDVKEMEEAAFFPFPTWHLTCRLKAQAGQFALLGIGLLGTANEEEDKFFLVTVNVTTAARLEDHLSAIGKIVNHPELYEFEHGLKCGDLVQFGVENIIAIMPGPNCNF